MGWRAANSLLVLRDQIDLMYPGRSKASDGTIGDAAHQAEVSDHNPDASGVVRALDITHDPASGCDIDVLSDWLCESRDPRIKYVIANRMIMDGAGGDNPWVWTDYDGSDPHTNHLHLSVVADGRADNTAYWKIGEPPMSTIDGAYLDYLPDTVTAILTGKTPSLGYPDATGPSWDNQTLAVNNVAAVEARLTNAINAAKAEVISAVARPTIDYVALAKALIEELGKRA
jgi:hypothetical protein